MLILFALVFARITGLFLGAPILSQKGVPMRFRVLITSILAAALLPTVDTTHMPSDGYAVAVALVSEIAVGYAFGLLARLMLTTFQAAGAVIAFQMGFAMARTIDPTDRTQVPVIGTIYLSLTSIVFLLLDGHHLLIRSVAASYNTFPLGVSLQTQVLVETLFGAGATLYEMAARVAGPVTGVMLLMNSIIGFINRAIPQLSIFNVGFPMTIFTGLLAVTLAIPGVVAAFLRLYASFEEQLLGLVVR